MTPTVIDTETTVVVSVGRSGVRVQGAWPGWPLAITLLLFTQDASHRGNADISLRVAELFDGTHGRFAIGNFEHALQDWGFVHLEDPFTFQEDISAREYFELLQDECRRIMRFELFQGGPLVFGPYLLRDGFFTTRDRYALAPARP